MKVVIGTFLILGSLLASQGMGLTVTPNVSLRKHGIPEVCNSIEHACQKALSKPGNAPDFNAIDDCLVPILNGKTIKGVKVPKVVLKACKDAVDSQVEHETVHTIATPGPHSH
jgi:hypothetical protein